jgi:hypothetical protein
MAHWRIAPGDPNCLPFSIEPVFTYPDEIAEVPDSPSPVLFHRAVFFSRLLLNFMLTTLPAASVLNT